MGIREFEIASLLLPSFDRTMRFLTLVSNAALALAFLFRVSEGIQITSSGIVGGDGDSEDNPVMEGEKDMESKMALKASK